MLMDRPGLGYWEYRKGGSIWRPKLVNSFPIRLTAQSRNFIVEKMSWNGYRLFMSWGWLQLYRFRLQAGKEGWSPCWKSSLTFLKS
jgi:hypothetical protein